jgi:MrcB-like, N-terminal domain
MPIRDLLLDVAEGYNVDSVTSLGHLRLRRAAADLQPYLPGGLTVEASGGKGNATPTPWIGVLDPDETDSPQAGIYVVYIYAVGLGQVVLSLNQGVNTLLTHLGTKKALQRLSVDAQRVRDRIGTVASITDLGTQISLNSRGRLQRAYEAGNIVGIPYELATLPTEAELAAQLARFLMLYQSAIAAKRELLLSDPGAIATPSIERTNAVADPLVEFKPKDDSDYIARLAGRRLLKTRRHETLVADFGRYVQKLGLKPATNVHPRDMTITGGEQEWQVEAKVIYQGNATSAVREAIGQLLTYRHFLYADAAPPRLLALFSEPIGGAYVISSTDSE